MAAKKAKSVRVAPEEKTTPEQLLENAIADNFSKFPEEVRKAMEEAANEKLAEMKAKAQKDADKKAKLISPLTALLDAYYKHKDAADSAKTVLDEFIEANKKALLKDAKSIVTESGVVTLKTDFAIEFENVNISTDELISLLEEEKVSKFIKQKIGKTDFEKLLNTKEVLALLQKVAETKESNHAADILMEYGVVGFCQKESISIRRPA